MDNFGIWSLLPPLVAIVLCITTKQLIISLFLGAFAGAMVLSGCNPIAAFVATLAYIVKSVANDWNASILVFTMVLGGFIGLLGKSGAMQGLVKVVIRSVNTRIRGQLAACLLSVLLFFDDYTSIILSGVVARPVTDKLRISREKLSYIVDSCGAGVAATAPVSNWTAYEVGVIGTVITAMGLTENAYMVFLSSIPYRFYCIFSVLFVFVIVLMGRDFGKMYVAERRAITTGEVFRPGSTPMAGLDEKEFSAPEGTPMYACNFFIPLATFFIVAFIGFFITGGGFAKFAAKGLAGIMGAADVINMMSVAIVVATMVLGVMMRIQKIMNVTQITDVWVNGMKAILFTIVFIVLAWTVAGFCKSLGTANYVVGALVASNFPAWILPSAVFIIAGTIAFATGSSWGTMALVLPLALPAAVGLDANFAATLGGVLTGATFGDHVSPISESVVMSSMSAACDHMDHVMTQVPYALTVCVISLIFGFIPAGLGIPVWMSIAAGTAACLVFIRFVGKKTDYAVSSYASEECSPLPKANVGK